MIELALVKTILCGLDKDLDSDRDFERSQTVLYLSLFCKHCEYHRQIACFVVFFVFFWKTLNKENLKKINDI